MSLVNDMLKDLDDRRRGPKGAGLGAEKLVPVTASHGAGSGLKKLISFVGLLMLAAAVVFLGMQYFRQSDGFPELPLPGVLQQALQAPVERSSVADAPIANIPAPVLSSAAPSIIAPAQSPEQLELAMIAKRMEELEAQNRALLEAQAQMATRVATVVDAPAQEAVLVEQSVAQVGPFDVEPPSPAPDASYIDPAFADALAIDPAAAPMRSPTELSFADQDKGKTQEALMLWGRNQRAEAVALLQGFIDANSLAHQSRETLAKLMLQQNDIVAVTVLVQQGMAVAPEFVGYRKLQARLLLSGGMTQEAVRLLSDKPPLVSVDNEYHDLLATAQLSAMDFAGAAKSYQSLVQQNRNEARWWYGLAAAQDGLGRETEALRAYQQALSLPSLSAGLRQRSEQRVTELRL